jgi:hypothetical protein
VRRETRSNLVFLVVFLVFTLPGAVILFKKKLDPTAHRLDQPDPVLRRLPYMSPPPAPPDIKWIVPDRTQAWVRSLTAPLPTLSAAPPGPQWEPVISQDHMVQLLAVSPQSDALRLTLLVWSDKWDTGRAFNLSVDDGMPQTRTVNEARREVPSDVRRELVMAGFVRPPKSILLLQVDAAGLRPSPSHHLEVSSSGSPPDLHTSLEFVPPLGVVPASRP